MLIKKYVMGSQYNSCIVLIGDVVNRSLFIAMRYDFIYRNVSPCVWRDAGLLM